MLGWSVGMSVGDYIGYINSEQGDPSSVGGTFLWEGNSKLYQ